MRGVLIITALYNILQFTLGEENFPDDYSYCFQFTWLNQGYDGNFNTIKINCSIPEPCVEYAIVTNDSSSPNVTHMWEVQYKNKRSQISCPLVSGNVCIKYSYTFDNAIKNITYFCGKMIEDETTAINSGCYTQQVGGYIIETCACISNGGHMPCNNSSGIHLSLIQIIMKIIIVLFTQQTIKLLK